MSHNAEYRSDISLQVPMATSSITFYSSLVKTTLSILSTCTMNLPHHYLASTATGLVPKLGKVFTTLFLQGLEPLRRHSRHLNKIFLMIHFSLTQIL